jgi:phage terminase large subunit-like protein
MPATIDEYAEVRAEMTPDERERFDYLLAWQPLADYETWLRDHFPDVCTQPLAARHHRLWQWADSLERGVKPKSRVEVWPRGGGKSSTGEMCVARVGCKLTRRFALIVSATQVQAEKHVTDIGNLFEMLGVERAVNLYGYSKGWKHSELKTSNGFTVAAYGLDSSPRGLKSGAYRPDLIIFDDIDDQSDTVDTVTKKIEKITTALIPAGSSDCAILFLQNMIHEESIVAQLVDNRADFLLNREPAYVEPALVGFQYEVIENPNGPNTYRITGGEPTWAGQGIDVCQGQLNDLGLKAFKREVQHEVKGADGYFFNVSAIKEILSQNVPELRAVCLAADLAATEGGGNSTVLSLSGVDYSERFYRLAMIRGQWGSDRVRECLKLATAHYRTKYPKLHIRLPQDPGQAGKAQATGMRKEIDGASVQVVTGKKWTRATNFSEQVNLGNYFMVCEDLPDWLCTARNEQTDFKPLIDDPNKLSWKEWHRTEREELRKFKEGIKGEQQDDIVDADSDAHNELMRRKKAAYA